MIIPSTLRHTLTLLLCSFMFVPTLLAEEERKGEIPYPTDEETLAFLKKRLPLAVTLMEQVRKQEGEEEYKEVLEEAMEQFYEYRELLHHDGKELANLHLNGVRIELEIAQQIDLFHDEGKTEEEKEAIRRTLRAAVKKQLINEKKIKEFELKETMRQLNELKKELAELNAINEKEISEEIRELLSDEAEDEEPEGEGKEESEKEDEDIND